MLVLLPAKYQPARELEGGVNVAMVQHYAAQPEFVSSWGVRSNMSFERTKLQGRVALLVAAQLDR
jgi:hypothetical protein